MSKIVLNFGKTVKTVGFADSGPDALERIPYPGEQQEGRGQNRLLVGVFVVLPEKTVLEAVK